MIASYLCDLRRSWRTRGVFIWPHLARFRRQRIEDITPPDVALNASNHAMCYITLFVKQLLQAITVLFSKRLVKNKVISRGPE